MLDRFPAEILETLFLYISTCQMGLLVKTGNAVLMKKMRRCYVHLVLNNIDEPVYNYFFDFFLKITSAYLSRFDADVIKKLPYKLERLEYWSSDLTLSNDLTVLPRELKILNTCTRMMAEDASILPRSLESLKCDLVIGDKSEFLTFISNLPQLVYLSLRGGYPTVIECVKEHALALPKSLKTLKLGTVSIGPEFLSNLNDNLEELGLAAETGSSFADLAPTVKDLSIYTRRKLNYDDIPKTVKRLTIISPCDFSKSQIDLLAIQLDHFSCRRYTNYEIEFLEAKKRLSE